MKYVLENKLIIPSQQKTCKLELAKKIYKGMIDQKISRTELAILLEKKPGVITRWLSGTHNFTIDTLVEIQTTLKIKLI